MSDALGAIDEFVELTIRQRREGLHTEDRWRLEALDELLRDIIEGARPAPRRISNPSAKHASSSVSPAEVVITATPRATAERRAPESQPPRPTSALGNPRASAPAAHPAEQKLSTSDRKKIREIDAADLPKSGYTPPVAPCFLEDYYTADLALLSAPTNTSPARVVAAESGGSLELLQEARLLLGVGGSERPPVAREVRSPAAAAQPRPRPARPAAPRSSNAAIVHLLAGGSKRGDLAKFDPQEGSVSVTEAGGGVEQIPLEQVLAIFFGVGRAPQTPPAGQRLVVKLINDRELIGLSPDYAPGVPAMTLVPDDRRANFDRVWVPAWSVKEIHLA